MKEWTLSATGLNVTGTPARARPVGQSLRAGEQRLGLGRLDEQRRQAGQVRPRRRHQRLAGVGVVDVAGGQLHQRDAVEPRIGVGGRTRVLGRSDRSQKGDTTWIPTGILLAGPPESRSASARLRASPPPAHSPLTRIGACGYWRASQR